MELLALCQRYTAFSIHIGKKMTFGRREEEEYMHICCSQRQFLTSGADNETTRSKTAVGRLKVDA